MNPPPPQIDKARVLWWAWAGTAPFGLCGDVEIYGFAICTYDSLTFYRFSCDKNWETINDMDHDSEEDAKTSIPSNYAASLDRIHWQKMSP